MKKDRGKSIRHSRKHSLPMPVQPKQPVFKQTIVPAATSSAADQLLQRAREHHVAGQLAEAEALYLQVLQTSPNHPVALHLLGVLACQVGNGTVALELVDRAILVNSGDADTHCTRGNALHVLQRYEDAAESYSRAILLKPDHAEAYNNRGGALHALGRHEEALECYDRAILLQPNYAESHNNRGTALQSLKRNREAIESFDRAIALRPNYAETYFNRGNTLQAMGSYLEAIANYDRAIQLKPHYAEAYNNRGSALHTLEQYQAELESCDKALSLNPNYADAHSNRGNALQLLRQYEASIESYDKAILLKPDFADAYYNRGNVQLILKQYKAALESYDKVLLFHPNYEYMQGMRLHLRRFLCDWENISDERRQLEAAIKRNETVAIPFAILAMIDSPQLQRQVAEIYVRDKALKHPPLAAIPRRPKSKKIRIGYYSADYFSHATSYLMAELFEQHDRNQFEIMGFSFSPDTVDEMSQRVSKAMDRFVDVRMMPDREVAELSRKLEVDIAVDLKGFTRDCRPGIFAERAAPIQVSYLGYPGTMSAEYIDYLIADATLIPENSRKYYSEKIVYLPDSYQVNDSLRAISDRSFVRAEEGLPESAFVYCCFNSLYKITPEVFDIWMRILGRVEGSVLWLLEENPWAGDNLRKEAARRGIAPERLVFAKLLPSPEHLARHRLADLFLDTLPYNAHTTASDALWAGLPLLTRMGKTFAGRVAASLLRAMNLPELVVTTEAEYEEMAVELARDRDRLQALRQRMQENRQSAPLFNCQKFTRHLESAYRTMIERDYAGLPPEHLYIK